MAIEERKGKNGLISFRMIAYDGYKINKNGKYVQNRITKTFKPPKDMPLREARRIAQQMDLDFNNQFRKEEVSGGNMTLNDAWTWFKKYYAPNYLRPSTFKTMETVVDKKIIPELGHIRLAHFTPNRITMFLNDVAIIKDKETGKPLKPTQYYKDSYIKLIFSKLHSIFDVAIKQGWIKENPCANAIKPRRNKTKKKPPLETEHIKDLLKRTEEYNVFNMIIRFQLYTGMRIGETLALTWDDINFDKRTIDINKTVNFVQGEFLIGPPKTENSYRILGMNDTVVNLLKLVKEEQDKAILALENKWQDNNLVFTQGTGNYIHRNNVNRYLTELTKDTNYNFVTVHALRHANATLLLMNGVDLKIVSAYLGHHDIQITADIYCDVLKSQRQVVAQLIDFNLNSE